MARLWSELAGNYFVNLHGESTARLSRNQRLLPLPEVTTTGMISVIKKALLNAPDRYYDALNELWVDKISYAAHWRTFMASTLKDWRQISLWAMLLLVSAFGIFGVSLALKTSSTILVSCMQSACLVSVLFCLISIASSLVLLRAYRHHDEAHASEAVDFLENACHVTYGLQPLAIMFALPWASFIWAFLSFAICILLLSLTIDFLAFRVLIWTAIAIACIGGYMALLFLSSGATSLSATRLRSALPVSDQSISYALAPARLVGVMCIRFRKAMDNAASIIFREIKRLRHGRAQSSPQPEP